MSDFSSRYLGTGGNDIQKKLGREQIDAAQIGEMSSSGNGSSGGAIVLEICGLIPTGLRSRWGCGPAGLKVCQ
jgi:hypothetical protein